MIDRRVLLLAAAAAPFASVGAGAHIIDMFIDLESRHDGRLGVSVLDTASGGRLEHRGDERFPMCSTFKLLAGAGLLHRVDQGREHLDRFIKYGPADLLDYAPVTREHVGEGGMTLGALVAAAVQWSDNTAANLVLAQLGGPAGVTAYMRTLGDAVTRLDRTEPSANTCIPGDPRDTTSPNAMRKNMQTILLGDALSPASRAKMLDWLVNYRTRMPRIAAGLPAGWTSGHKMGTGANGTANDLAIIWPPKRAPILVAAYYTSSKEPDAERNGVLAEVGRIVAEEFATPEPEGSVRPF